MMIQISKDTFINANEVAIMKFTDKKKIFISLINGAEMTTQASTEEKTEKLFRQLVTDIDQLQRQAVR